jgi:hypothetical protein
MKLNQSTLLLLAGAVLLSPVACISAEDDAEDVVQTISSAGLNDRPWEVTSAKGESILPNVFYAEASENEQVMPLTIRGRYPIDRMIYPTIGNPKLYVKEDPADSVMIVLRIEEEALAHLAPDMRESVPNSSLNVLKLQKAPANALSFSFVKRAGRAASTESPRAIANGAPDVVTVEPTALLVHPVPGDMPEAFKKRRTVRCVFSRAAMAQVPEGLYDVRFEVKKNGAILPVPRGEGGVYEYQYNALRVFDRAPPNDEYTALNVTDTQASVGLLYSSWGTTQLEQFVRAVNTSTDPSITRASFITFNGDLHNGGSPGGVLERYVAGTYNAEATVILDALKELRLPIFLTPGNHDGYASTGVAPKWVVTADRLIFESLKEVIEENKPAWPGFRWDDYARYLQRVDNQPGGLHRDVFVGAHVRREDAQTFGAGWIPVPRSERNMVLYDGFHQWQRTYGPLHASFTFGKTRFVNLNTFDLRQHRRTGWGMFIANYGGGMSQVQLAWLARELDRGKQGGQDIVLLAHHDPRGGHKGKDFGYYYEQLDFVGMGQSVVNYVKDSTVTPVLCKLPDWALTTAQKEDCLHDGLSEWMRADEEFDCAASERLGDGRCNVALFDTSLPPAQRRHPLFSGYDFVHKLATNPNVRTLILGHTHYNALEILQPGEALVPDEVAIDQLDKKLAAKLAAYEVENPVRAFAWQQRTPAAVRHADADADAEYDPLKLRAEGITSQNGHFLMLLGAASHTFRRVVEGDRRELAILRLTSNADMTSQKLDRKDGNGFSVLHFTRKKDGRDYALPQVNKVSFRINDGRGRFDQNRTVELDRTASLATHGANNPVRKLFEGGPLP